MNFKPRALKILEFVRILRVEPFLLLMAFQMGLKQSPHSQLAIDKICSQWYNTTVDYCHDLPSSHEEGTDPGHYKTRILGDASVFATYNFYAETPTGIIWALFIGAWVDRYVKGRKVILILFIIAGAGSNLLAMYASLSWSTSVYYNIILSLPAAILVGGQTGPRIAITHYITSTTPPKLLAIRFMIFNSCMVLGIPIGNSLGAYILVQNPAFHTGEIRNYTLVYIVALVVEIIALLWVILMINEEVARKQEHKIEMQMKGLSGKVANNEETPQMQLKSDMTDADRGVSPLRLLFDLKNVKAMIKTIIKKRPNKARRQIALLMISLAILAGEYSGLMEISGKFVQRVYHWNPDWNSYMSSISMFSLAVGTTIIIPVASKIFNVTDIPLGLYGFSVSVIVYLIKGVWLNEKAFYVSMAINAVGGTAAICVRSYISKIVDRAEIGKIMSFMTTLDTVAPMVCTALFGYIFKYTVDKYPGTLYLVIAGLSIIPVLVMIWINYCTERPLVEGELSHLENNQDEYKTENHHGHVINADEESQNNLDDYNTLNEKQDSDERNNKSEFTKL